ncbi:MAG: hypothetical protein SFU57_02310 [Gemmatimonadales bacterium]|jgi:hypothetical protein|nr:hypothetical protein [Gemmatimonadales bacterium]
MPVVEDLKKAFGTFPAVTPDPAELARLQQFFAAMKTAGIAKTREYDLPQPDTIGRAAVNLPLRGHLTRR